jgi:hypothetical protein
MKKIKFNTVYICTNCKKKIVGYTKTCPICKNEVIKSSEDKIVTFVKRI